LAAARPRRAGQPPDGSGAAPVPQVGLLEALQDAVVLADGDGMIAAASARLEDMFGYGPGELAGLPAESLVPAGLQEAHRRQRAAWAVSPSARLMGEGMQLAGLRKDGATFPVRVSLTPVTTASGQLTLAIIRDVNGTGLPADAARQRTEAVLGELDDLIHQIRAAAFAEPCPPPPRAPGDDR